MAEIVRYSDAELEEFRVLIQAKIDKARAEYEQLQQSIRGDETSDTAPTLKAFEDGASFLQREEISRLAQRQLKFIQNLEAALVRIDNKTYGICRETGKLIPKERLRAVPHATLSIEAKGK